MILLPSRALRICGSFAIPPVTQKTARLCRDGKRAMWSGIRAVTVGGKLNAIGRAVAR